METIAHGVSLSTSVWEVFKENKTNSFRGEPEKYCFQLPMGRGNSLKNDFYTFFSNNDKEVVTKNTSSEKAFNGGTYHHFDTKLERTHFTEYLRTDFARFCLALTKINKHLDSGELELVPYLDFKEEWDDAKLYKHFNIDQKTQDYITNFLPDYYGIRQ